MLIIYEFLKHKSINNFVLQVHPLKKTKNLPGSAAADKGSKYYYNFHNRVYGSPGKRDSSNGDGKPSCLFQVETCTDCKDEEKDTDTEHLTICYAEKIS